MKNRLSPIEFYRFKKSGHSYKVQLFMSLLNLSFRKIDVDLQRGEQKSDWFIKLNPFGTVPVIRDNGKVVADSHAILIYLALTYGDEVWYPRNTTDVVEVQRWMSVSAGILAYGPGAARLITLFGMEFDSQEAISRAHGLLAVMEKELAQRQFLVGEKPTIADIANYTYIAHAPEGNVSLHEYPHVRAWLARIENLPGFVPMPQTSMGLEKHDAMQSPVFHHGELMLQERVGVKGSLTAAVKSIRPYMSEKLQDFLSTLPYVLLCGYGKDGQLWASLRYGAPGFIQIIAPNIIYLKGQQLADDPLRNGWKTGQSIALLGFAAHIKRRYRINGVIHDVNRGGLVISIHQSYRNCAKYIRPRLASLMSKQDVEKQAEKQWLSFEGKKLSPLACSIIKESDSLFIASAHPMGLYPESRVEGADISHRGGAPGFVYVQDKSCLILPDYSGNKYFNTIGNVLLNPQVALLFISYETARVLWIRANAELNERQYLDIPQFADAERLLVLQITACRLATNPVPLQWLAVAEPNSEESLMQN